MEDEITTISEISNSLRQSTDENYKEKVTKVGKNTPAEDFLALVDAFGFGQGGDDLEYFQDIGNQLEMVIEDLLFETEIEDTDKITDAIVRYRLESILYAPWQYNEFIGCLKQSILKTKKHDFWENIIVKRELGIITMLESDLTQTDEDQSTEFYKI